MNNLKRLYQRYITEIYFSCTIIGHYQDAYILMSCIIALIISYFLRKGTRLDRENLYSYVVIHCYVDIYTYTGNTRFHTVHIIYIPISRVNFPSNESRKTPPVVPWGRRMGVWREFEMWPKFYLRGCCDVCNNVLYSTAIYRESIVFVSSIHNVLHHPLHWNRNCWTVEVLFYIYHR